METNKAKTSSGSKYSRYDRMATPADFEELFASNMNELYGLAFLLTADTMKAISCVVAALDDCVGAMTVFAECAGLWARRAVAKNAIAVALEPDPWLASGVANIANSECDDLILPVNGLNGNHFDYVGGLDPLERIVFVLCSVEGYSIQDCAHLIGRTAQDVVDMQVRTQSEMVLGQAGVPTV